MPMRLAPYLFVLLWSSGFIGSKLGAADAEPFTFLSLRFLLVLALLLPVAAWQGRLGGGWTERRHAIVAGALLHGGYLGGVFWAIRNGMPAGVAALLVSLQPVVTSVLAGPLLGEKLSPRHWAGLGLGLAGAVLILWPKLSISAPGFNAATIAATMVALVTITAGTLYQKRFAASAGLIEGAIWQYAGALAIAGTLALAFETRAVVWSPRFIFALGWLVLVLSIGAIMLLMVLIRHHAVAGLSGIFYLVPAVTALLAFLIFGETLTPVQFGGMALAIAAVGLITMRKPAPPLARAVPEPE
jgi:drug/metabolite transporter (DMT)-like permease